MTTDLVGRLVGLLQEADAVPHLAAGQITRSPLYDPLYRAVLVILTLKLCGKREGAMFALNHQKLRLFQFVALHAALLDPLKEWVSARRVGGLVPLERWTRFPSGYAADTVFDDVITYLEVAELISRNGTRIRCSVEEAEHGIGHALEEVERRNLFVSERAVLSELSMTSVPLNLLKG